MQAKTILEWFQDIEYPEIREAAIKNALLSGTTETKASSLVNALWDFVAWDNTEEGFDFWKSVVFHYENEEENIPEKPLTPPFMKTVHYWINNIIEDPQCRNALLAQLPDHVANIETPDFATAMDVFNDLPSIEGKVYWIYVKWHYVKKMEVPALPEYPISPEDRELAEFIFFVTQIKGQQLDELMRMRIIKKALKIVGKRATLADLKNVSGNFASISVSSFIKKLNEEV